MCLHVFGSFVSMFFEFVVCPWSIVPKSPFLKKYFAKVKVNSIVTTLNKKSSLRMIIRCSDFNRGLDQLHSNFILKNALLQRTF